MAKRTETDPDSRAKATAVTAPPFRRLLVVIDDSPSAEAAVDLVAEWVDGPGADVRFVQVNEEHRQARRNARSPAGPLAAQPHRLVVGGPTLGARNRLLVHGIAAAAKEFAADLIVLGFDRRRLAGHRLAPSLRARIVRATDLPVLLAPVPPTDGKPHHRWIPELHHDGERAHGAHRDVHV